MKKRTILWLLLLLIVFGGNVKAAGSREDEILNKTEEAMKQVRVICNDITINGKLLMEVKADQNTGVSGMTMETGEIWSDTKAKIMYISSEGTYYFMPVEGNDSDTQINTDLSGEIDRTLNFTYVGIETYTVNSESVSCYKLSASYTEQGYTIEVNYYINKDSYRLVAIEEYMPGTRSISHYYYPESVTVPQKVKDKALIFPAYSFTKKKITYMVTYEKKKPVLYVIDGRKAKGDVKIPDTIRLYGKDYKVRGIGPAAFKKNGKIKSVSIGENVKVISGEAFCSCKKLSKVTIQSKKITKIGKRAFYDNSATLKFKVPKSKRSKYKKLIQKSGISSKLVVK